MPNSVMTAKFGSHNSQCIAFASSSRQEIPLNANILPWTYFLKLWHTLFDSELENFWLGWTRDCLKMGYRWNWSSRLNVSEYLLSNDKDLFWCYIKQIIECFFHSCNGTHIFIRWKMKCSIQLGFASLNGTFHLSPQENICTLALINIHYLYTNFTLKSKCKFINLIHTQQKNKIICLLSWNIIKWFQNATEHEECKQLYPVKKSISRWDVHIPKVLRVVWAQYAEYIGHFQHTPRIY